MQRTKIKHDPPPPPTNQMGVKRNQHCFCAEIVADVTAIRFEQCYSISPNITI